MVDYVWSPNGREIALLVLDPDPEPTKDDAKDDDKPPKPIVIDRFQFKRDIDGYLGNRRQRLMLLDVATGQARRLTLATTTNISRPGRPTAAGSPSSAIATRIPTAPTTTTSGWCRSAAQAPTRLTTFAGDGQQSGLFELPGVEPRRAQHRLYPGRPGRALLLRHAPSCGGPGKRRRAAHPHPRLDRNVGNPFWSADGKSLQFIVEDDKTQYLASVPASGGPSGGSPADGR